MSINRSPAALAKRFVWQFYHRGGEGAFTRASSRFDAELQARLVHLAEVEAGEVPAIAAYQDEANWMVLTSHHLRWSQQGIKRQLALADLEGVTPELMKPGRATFPLHHPIHVGLPLPRITLLTKEGTLEVECEPRGPYYGFLNVVLLMARMKHPSLRKAASG